jgi:ribonucleoside-diphosphate reductase beta chain
MSVFKLAGGRESHIDSLAFLDPNGGVTVQRYDTMKYRQIDRLTDTQLGFFWRPQEVDVMKDGADFKALTPHEQHIFTSNLKRQIVLDSVQGRSPCLAFLPIASLPEVEGFISIWNQSEGVHSRSYSHVIKNIYPNPSTVFDGMMDIEEIVNCATDISKHYDRLIELTMWYRLLGEGTHIIASPTFDGAPAADGTYTATLGSNTRTIEVSLREIKKALWLTLMSVNVLEGIRFYVSFACSWAFAEMKKLEGNAKIIKLICRDENLHLAFTQTLLKLLPRDDPDFVSIAEECREESIQLFRDAVDQEKVWAKYLFKDGSMIGLNEQLLSDYIEWIADKRLQAVGLPSLYKAGKNNPLPWTQKWIAGADVQVAPQEVEISSYQIGAVKRDVSADTFKGFKL